MSEMVERVAKVIFEARSARIASLFPARYGYSGAKWENAGEEDRASELASARAAIEAMREPTERMIQEAWASALAEDARAVWKDMIDEALK